MRGKGKGDVVSGFWVREPWPLFLHRAVPPPPSYLHHIFQSLQTFCSESIPCQFFPVLLPHLPNYTPTTLPLLPVFLVASFVHSSWVVSSFVTPVLVSTEQPHKDAIACIFYVVLPPSSLKLQLHLPNQTQFPSHPPTSIFMQGILLN